MTRAKARQGTPPWFPLYVDDYEAATAHLTLEEDGAYTRLLRLAWRQPDCSLPDDEQWIRRMMRVRDDEEWCVVSRIISEFFAREKGRYASRRLSKERAFMDRQKTNGKKGGRPKSTENNNKTDNPNETQTESHTEPKERQADNPDESPRVRSTATATATATATYSASLRSAEQPRATADAELAELERWRNALIAASGGAVSEVSPAIVAVPQIARWRSAGVSLELDAVPFVARRCAGRSRATIQSWAAFGDGPIEAMQRRTAPVAGTPSPTDPDARRKRWAKMVEGY